MALLFNSMLQFDVKLSGDVLCFREGIGEGVMEKAPEETFAKGTVVAVKGEASLKPE